MKFSSVSNTNVQRCAECSNPQDRINKMVNEHIADYHPSPSELTSRIYPLIFLWTPKGFISPEYFFIFFLSLYITPWLRKSFNLMLLRSPENTFMSQKIESAYFYSCPKQNSSPGSYPFLPKTYFENIFLPAEIGEDYLAEKMTKIKLADVLVTSFNKFHRYICICGFYYVVPQFRFNHVEV